VARKQRDEGNEQRRDTGPGAGQTGAGRDVVDAIQERYGSFGAFLDSVSDRFDLVLKEKEDEGERLEIAASPAGRRSPSLTCPECGGPLI